jgi:hypothetical protein
MKHECKTSDGVVIVLGLRVRDYDHRIGMVVEAPHDYEFNDEVCWPRLHHNGHWWGVCTDSEGHKHVIGECRATGHFDGSRMTTRFGPVDYAGILSDYDANKAAIERNQS